MPLNYKNTYFYKTIIKHIKLKKPSGGAPEKIYSETVVKCFGTQFFKEFDFRASCLESFHFSFQEINSNFKSFLSMNNYFPDLPIAASD